MKKKSKIKNENYDLKRENSRLKNKIEELNIELKDKNHFKNKCTGLEAENNRLKEELQVSREFERSTFERTVCIYLKYQKSRCVQKSNLNFY